MNRDFLIHPTDISVGQVQPKVVLCFSENHFYRLLEMCKTRSNQSFGPCKRAEMEGCTLIGRVFGAALAVFIVELLAHNGAQEILLFGSCGALPNQDYKIGDLCSAKLGTDLTQTTQDYQLEPSQSLQVLGNRAVKQAGHLVSIHSLFAMSLAQFPKTAELVDLETVPAAIIAAWRKLTVFNLLLVNDQLARPWCPTAERPAFKVGLNKALQILKTYTQPSLT